MLRLLLPALIPSWRFFDTIAPSPRIEFALLDREEEAAPNWRAFRPHPNRLSFGAMLRRLFWNPLWNESLFLVTCAERLLEQPSSFRENEILRRVAHAIELGEIESGVNKPRFVRVRIVVLRRGDSQIQGRVMFTSRALRLVPAS